MTMTSYAQAKPRKHQRKTPCHDCPWRRTAVPGWLGPYSPAEWLAMAHGEAQAECHTTTSAHQCAGFAVYRANVCKTPRDPEAFSRPADHAKVFSTPVEFEEHHDKSWNRARVIPIKSEDGSGE